MGYLLRRALTSLLTTLVAVSLVFLAIRVVPNNPFLARFGQHAVPEQVEAQMQQQGWNDPLVTQLGRFLRQAIVHGELGESFL
jgi:ABC-type dipeptide/oligopeptide/nickel transport system permease component